MARKLMPNPTMPIPARRMPDVYTDEASDLIRAAALKGRSVWDCRSDLSKFVGEMERGYAKDESGLYIVRKEAELIAHAETQHLQAIAGGHLKVWSDRFS